MTDPAPTTNVLDAALARVHELDPRLAATLRREVDELREGRSFGLVFNRHLPESVRLPNHPIKRGVKVALRNPQVAAKTEKDATWRVVRVERADTGDRVAWLAGLDTPRTVDDLVVVRDFGEPVYPGLRSVEKITRGGDAPHHVVINGENHHVLQALLMTHRAKIDLIYIDPPYNTGNQGWIYNDKYVDTSKGDASSKWLSFMERRLKIARELLTDTGVIIVAIGDDEHHRLRMLMDQVFGPQNFVSNIVWQGGRKNDARYVSNGADYMLVYASNSEELRGAVPRWAERRAGVDEILAAGEKAWAVARGDTPRERARAAESALKDWQRSLPKDHPVRGKGLSDFTKVDEQGEVYRLKDISWPGGGGPRYDVLHPATGEPVKVPGRGWIFSDPMRMQEEIAAGRVIFGPDHNHYINRKSPLREADAMGPESVFVQKRTAAGQYLAKVLGDKRFPFPKDHEVLMRWFRMAAPSDAVILDFFGGSGTTAEAVMRLNAEDGGTRQAILVTNNELGVKDAKALTKAGHAPGDEEWEARGVFEYVTRPRLSTVVTGIRPDGSVYSEGLDANVEFFETVYLDESRVARAREFTAIAPLLWMQAGGVGERIETEPDAGWALTDRYGVLFTEDATRPFLAALAEQPLVAEAAPTHVFVVTDSDSHFADVAGRLRAGVKAVRLYESYLKNFEINVETHR